MFGFGDKFSQGEKVFPLVPDENFPEKYCEGFEEVLEVYNKKTPKIKLHGPTNFAPLIKKSIEIVKSGPRLEYHILVIITDGQVTPDKEKETIDSIVEASKYPLSIIIIGVGDGPWGKMKCYDDELPERNFDNV